MIQKKKKDVLLKHLVRLHIWCVVYSHSTNLYKKGKTELNKKNKAAAERATARGNVYMEFEPTDNSEFKVAVSHRVPRSVAPSKEPESVWRSHFSTGSPRLNPANLFVISCFAASRCSDSDANQTLPVAASHLKLQPTGELLLWCHRRLGSFSLLACGLASEPEFDWPPTLQTHWEICGSPDCLSVLTHELRMDNSVCSGEATDHN